MDSIGTITSAQRIDAAYAAMKINERLRAATLLAARHLDMRAITIVRELKNDHVDTPRIDALVTDILAHPPAYATAREIDDLRKYASGITAALNAGR